VANDGRVKLTLLKAKIIIKKDFFDFYKPRSRKNPDNPEYA